jgi:hypothetical protein
LKVGPNDTATSQNRAFLLNRGLQTQKATKNVIYKFAAVYRSSKHEYNLKYKERAHFRQQKTQKDERKRKKNFLNDKQIEI